MELKEFFNFWTGVQASILNMAEQLKEDDLKKTFDSTLDPIGETFYHIASAYDEWLTLHVNDGEEKLDEIPKERLTVENIIESLKKSFARCRRFLEKTPESDWNKKFIDYDENNKPYELTLGWILWHLAEHDIHHRAQLKLQYKFLKKDVSLRVFYQSGYFSS